jgi:hypothetical protein
LTPKFNKKATKSKLISASLMQQSSLLAACIDDVVVIKTSLHLRKQVQAFLRMPIGGGANHR